MTAFFSKESPFLRFLLTGVLLAGVVFVSTGCDDDDDAESFVTPPQANLVMFLDPPSRTAEVIETVGVDFDFQWPFAIVLEERAGRAVELLRGEVRYFNPDGSALGGFDWTREDLQELTGNIVLVPNGRMYIPYTFTREENLPFRADITIEAFTVEGGAPESFTVSFEAQ